MKNTMCPNCNRIMNTEVNFVVPSVSASSSAGAGNGGESVGGYVKGVITYIITDDLKVTPMSLINRFSIKEDIQLEEKVEVTPMSLINRFSIKKDIQLEEKVVVVGMKEGLALLEASLESPTVLTDVFCSSTKKRKAMSDSTEINVQGL